MRNLVLAKSGGKVRAGALGAEIGEIALLDFGDRQDDENVGDLNDSPGRSNRPC